MSAMAWLGLSEAAVGLAGVGWAIGLLGALRSRPPRFDGERGTVWGLLICGVGLALHGVSWATGWF